ncbi:MAG: flavin reductase family protein [Anaerolineales bacterium]
MEHNISLDPEQLRQVMRAWASGVTVVTAQYGEEWHGMTVSSFTSIALQPPLVAVSLQMTSRTHRLVSQAGAFAVTILAEDQREISERFAGRLSDQAERLAGLATQTLVTGAPLLEGGLAWLDCRVTQTIPAGGNTLFLAEVVAAQQRKKGRPLLYHQRHYTRLAE